MIPWFDSMLFGKMIKSVNEIEKAISYFSRDIHTYESFVCDIYENGVAQKGN